MPELPDLTIYVEALRARIMGDAVRSVRLTTPFLLRTVDPPLDALIGHAVIGVERSGRRIVLVLEDDLFLVFHLMIAGRLHWFDHGTKVGARGVLAAIELATGTLTLTEAGTKRRASLHVVRGRAGLEEHERGGLEVLEATAPEFAARLRSENHTIKHALTDPRLFSGIGNAYSDEILHRARLSPAKLTSRLSGEELTAVYAATRAVLTEWTDRLRADAAGAFPEHVTAFRDGMAVHGRYRQPCPVCGSPVLRIRYADNETNYCATCQTGGTPLADRALSRILK